VNLHRTEGRLARLLRDFRLGTITDALAALREGGDLQTWDPTSVA
jgi:hypothetical protein